MFIPLKKKGQPVLKKDFYTGVYYPVSDEDKKETKLNKNIKKRPVKPPKKVLLSEKHFIFLCSD